MKRTIQQFIILSLVLLPFQDSSANSPFFASLDVVSKVMFHAVGTTVSTLNAHNLVNSQLIPTILSVLPEELAVIRVSTQRGSRDAKPILEEFDTKSEKYLEMLQQVPNAVEGLLLTKAERSVIAITNMERVRRGIKPLMPDRALMESARKHAAWMSVSGVFQHGNVRAAENIAMGQRSSSAAMNSWMNSSGHRSNLLGSGHGKIGVGAYQSLGGQMYWCQQFIR